MKYYITEEEIWLEISRAFRALDFYLYGDDLHAIDDDVWLIADEGLCNALDIISCRLFRQFVTEGNSFSVCLASDLTICVEAEARLQRYLKSVHCSFGYLFNDHGNNKAARAEIAYKLSQEAAGKEIYEQ